MTDPKLREQVASDIVLMKLVGINPVIVHGGGPEITSYMNRLNLPVEFYDGLRVTTDEAMEVVKMVLVGKVNTELVAAINVHGRLAVGVSGDDGNLVRAKQRNPRLGRVGEVTHDRHHRHRQPDRGRLHPGRRDGRLRRGRRELQRERRPRRRQARRVARGRQGHLPHRRRRPVRGLLGQGLAHQRAHARRGRGDDRLGHAGGRDGSEGRRVRTRAALGRAQGPHPERHRAARAAARGLHRRRRGHHDRRRRRRRRDGGDATKRRSRWTPSA